MRIPRFWAEAKARDRQPGRQVTIQRFGWADNSQEEAQRHAQERADEGLAQTLSGGSPPKRERRVPYNGSDGLPIREEILSTHLNGAAILTRNSYGAQCLNVEDVLFADIDFSDSTWPNRWITVLCVVAALGLTIGLVKFTPASDLFALGLGMLSALLLTRLAGKRYSSNPAKRRERDMRVANQRIAKFLTSHPEWRIRIYESPAGLRLLAMHRTFNPVADADTIAECFQSLQVDPVYARMCRLQRCFRARVSPKPWRVGVQNHLRPRPGIWPIREEHMPRRSDWVQRYEVASEHYASCRFLEAVGSQTVDERAAEVRDLHDQLAQATSGSPIA